MLRIDADSHRSATERDSRYGVSVALAAN
jgi:hypothetical protein